MFTKFVTQQHLLLNETDGAEASGASEAEIADVDSEISEESLEMDSEDAESASEEGADSEMPNSNSEADGEEPETVAELQDAVEQAVEEGASQEEINNMIKKFELKVNGKTVEKEIDLSDEESLKRELQKAMAFTEKAKEAKELKSTYEQALQELINNPIQALADLGVDVNEVTSKHLLQQIEEEQKSPEQKEREAMQRELEAYRKQVKEAEEREAKAKEERIMQEQLANIQKELDEAWENANTNIPKNPRNISRVIEALEWAENEVDEVTGEKMFPNVSIADVMPLVEEEYFKEISEFVSSSPEDVLEQIGLAKRAQKAAAKAPAKKAPTNVSNLQKESAKAKSASVKSESAAEKKSARDFFRELTDKYGA